MERSKYLCLIVFLALQMHLIAQKEAIYQAFLKGDMQTWKSVMLDFEKQGETDKEAQLELLNYQYGYIGWCISQNNNQEAKQFLNKARNILKKLDKMNADKSILLAYKAAFVGYDIGLAPYKAPFIGPQSLEFAQAAKKQDSNNAMAHAQLGNIAYYTPKMFGGSKPEALKHYAKAIALFEKDTSLTHHNWNYLSILATYIEAYIGMGDYANAKALCEKTLAIEPLFTWVTDELYPQIKKHIKE